MTTIAVKPGGTAKLRYPLNFIDKVTVTIDWADWLSDGDTVASATWTANSGITATESETTDTTTEATIQVTTTTEGTYYVQCQIVTNGLSIRSVRIQLEVVDLI